MNDPSGVDELLARVLATARTLLATTDEATATVAWRRLVDLAINTGEAIQDLIQADEDRDDDPTGARVLGWTEATRALADFLTRHRRPGLGVPDRRQAAELAELIVAVTTAQAHSNVRHLHHSYLVAARDVARRRSRLTLAAGHATIAATLGLLLIVGLSWPWAVTAFILANIGANLVGLWYRTAGQRDLLTWWHDALPDTIRQRTP